MALIPATTQRGKHDRLPTNPADERLFTDDSRHLFFFHFGRNPHDVTTYKARIELELGTRRYNKKTWTALNHPILLLLLLFVCLVLSVCLFLYTSLFLFCFMAVYPPPPTPPSAVVAWHGLVSREMLLRCMRCSWHGAILMKR
jgi:hypothetical protein